MKNEKIAENCVSAFRQALEVAGNVFAKEYLKLSKSGNDEATDIADFREMLYNIGQSAKAEVINEEDVQMTAVCTIDLRPSQPSIPTDDDDDCDCMDDDEDEPQSADERLNASLDHLVEVLRDVRNNLRR